MDSAGVGDFLRQIPPGLIWMFCGSGVLLVLVVAYIIRERGKRARAVPMAIYAAPMSDGFDEGSASADLPDLDLLGNTESLKPKSAPRQSGTYTVALTDGETVEAVEVLSVLRDVGEGGLIIRIGDKAYRNPPAVADAEFKRRFQATLRDLNSAPTPVEASAEAPAPEAAAPDSAEASSGAPPEMPRFSPYESVPGDLPKFKMPDGPPVKPKRGRRPVAEPIPEINIAASIETFLQHKLTMMPQYANRSIHVRPAPHGGVTIEVDGSFYDSVGEVEDTTVRQFLSATIDEWQARQ